MQLGEEPSDYEFLKSRLLDRLRTNNLTQFEDLKDAPVVFGERRLRDLYNDKKAREFAVQTGQEFWLYFARDKLKGQFLVGEQRKRMVRVRTKDSKEALGRLPLIPGMPVMITENIAIGNRVVNGSEGILHSVVYKLVDGEREAICAYVKVPNSDLDLPGVGSQMVPIRPHTVRFPYKVPGQHSFQISRSQLPLIPGWSYTDYKAQGATLPKVVLDLASARGLQNAYVMLSRAPAACKVRILCWFSPQRISS
ncbi:hypothetical protein PAXRUDRAFT_168539 [Paxillus rubicundulus Ve08.2h10]|uniref:Uncharacterized protein n=1 Tax=Paxillus rubicundulus Ve08.2h10 TaxID=930991 RepID=A0A0D0D033_9AGAM|nr:hypothetical protein PAXRUDRAFT_168539 [Paxillus rubicundulus Ve08.2h10]